MSSLKFFGPKVNKFEPAENATMRKVVHATIAAHRLKNKPRDPDMAWYFNGIAQNRQGYSVAVARKNELTQPMVEHEISDKSWYTDNGEESFYNKTHIKEYVSHIPHMTYGLVYVLSLLKIDYISQMLAEFIKHINEDEDEKEVMNIYFKWLKSITKGTIAEEANVNDITNMIATYASEKGLFEYPYE